MGRICIRARVTVEGKVKKEELVRKFDFHFRSTTKKHHERREKDYIVELSESMSQNTHDAIKCFGWATLIVNHIIATLIQNAKYETHSSNAFVFVDHTNQMSLY